MKYPNKLEAPDPIEDCWEENAPEAYTRGWSDAIEATRALNEGRDKDAEIANLRSALKVAAQAMTRALSTVSRYDAKPLVCAIVNAQEALK